MSLLEDYLKIYEEKPKRKIHIEGVKTLSVALAKKYGLNERDMENAALLHDLTKYENDRFHLDIFEKYDKAYINDLPPFLYHGYSAGLLGKYHYQFNKDIVNAVTHHIIGRPKMSLFEKILMLSDKIEPSRDFEGVKHLRALAHLDIDEAFKQFLVHKYHYDQVHGLLNELALKTYHYYIKELI